MDSDHILARELLSMTWQTSGTESLRRVFNESFRVRDLAEPLVSLDADTPVTAAVRLMEMRDFEVVGVRQDGLVVGYVGHGAGQEGSCREYLQPFDNATVVSDDAPLADVIVGLTRSPRLFVRVLDAVGGIVTQSDLQKPPVRMWLFGIITLVEMRMGRFIEHLCDGETWRSFLSEGRLQKAEALLEERRRRSQNLQLIDCLQFSDKAQIIARNEAIRRLTRFTSRRQVEESCKALESLRNNLAHAQDILVNDWEIVSLLAADIDDVIFGTEQAQNAVRDAGS
jgi:CBS domain-containing protein